jgi:hypothetical protein
MHALWIGWKHALAAAQSTDQQQQRERVSCCKAIRLSDDQPLSALRLQQLLLRHMSEMAMKLGCMHKAT